LGGTGHIHCRISRDTRHIYPVCEKYPPLFLLGSVAAVCIYVVGGACFLKPVDKHSYLSVRFVFVAWMIFVPLLFLFDRVGASHYILTAFNPLSYFAAFSLFGFLRNNLYFIHLALFFLLPAIIPSLLIWIGLLIRTRVMKSK